MTCVILALTFGDASLLLLSFLFSGWRRYITLLSKEGFILFIAYYCEISGTLFVNIHKPVSY